MSKRRKAKYAVIDTETDPFKYGRVPRPFCVQFYSEEVSIQFWGNDCMARLASFLQALPDTYYIFAHNGGKFDFHFLHEFLENPIRIIKSRIVSAKIFHHTLRDSYAILPVPLRDYEKDVFDYSKMEFAVREKHKKEILKYLHSDCINLFELVKRFTDQFSLQLTIGSTAMKEIQKRYDFARMSESEDATFRRFYYGGRVQCFKAGLLKGPFEIYDVNSMYPYAMKNYRHPVNGSFEQTLFLPVGFANPYFVRFIGRNRGALPSIAEDGSLTFDKTEGEFLACSHELEIAFKYGLVEIDQILECHVAHETISFGQYVDDFFAMKIAAELSGDKALRLFAKLLLNSGYGKFGQNPDNFMDYLISRDPGEEPFLEEEGYQLDCEFPDFDLWARKSDVGERALFDVSIAASITSASRAILMNGLRQSIDPIYCDTDSIICRGFSGRTHATELGAWKLEKTGRNLAVAGKKLYALYDNLKDKPLKLASKGGTLTLHDIIKICQGGEVVHYNMAPTFSISRNLCETACMFPKACKCFISRKFANTVDTAETEE